jgi:hypothetical protein
VLLEGFSQLGHPGGEFPTLLGCALQLAESFPGVFVVVQRLGDEVLRLLALSESLSGKIMWGCRAFGA